MRKLIFMGTGPFALAALMGLYENLTKGDSLIVYTKESKKSGRGMKVTDGCVALFAKEKDLPLYQPVSFKEEEAVETFISHKADLAIVASYGLLLPSVILNAPEYGCINIHASLLPKYRGAAPINRAILDGEKYTGVTIMQMNEGLDTGDMLLKRETEILENENVGDLFDRLAVMGKDMMLEILPQVYAGTLTPEKQDENLSTYARKITKEDQVLSFHEDSAFILRKIRGLSPRPGAFCKMEKDNKILKIYAAEKKEGNFAGKCGEVIAVKPEVLVKTSDGAISLITVQPEGKAAMPARDAVNGRRIELGDILL